MALSSVFLGMHRGLQRGDSSRRRRDRRGKIDKEIQKFRIDAEDIDLLNPKDPGLKGGQTQDDMRWALRWIPSGSLNLVDVFPPNS